MRVDVEGGPGVLVLEVVEDLEGEVVVVGGVGRRGMGVGGYEGGEGGRGRDGRWHGGLAVLVRLFGVEGNGFSELVARSWRPNWFLES